MPLFIIFHMKAELNVPMSGIDARGGMRVARNRRPGKLSET
ncbi:MAG: hypothetical protein P8123_04915 [bacterium]